MSIFADRMTFRSGGETFTRELGRTLGELLEGGEIVVLVGELGSGKTTFVRGLAEGLGVADLDDVTSPTFLRLQTYEGRVPVHHVDAYRMEHPREELESLGGDELLESGGVVVVEWGDKLLRALPEAFLTLRFAHGDEETERLVRLVPRGLRYAEIALRLVGEMAARHGEIPEEPDPSRGAGP